MNLKEAYDKGFEDAKREVFRHINIFISNSGKVKIEDMANYNPPKEEELTIDLSGVPHVKGTPYISYELFDEEEEKYNTFDQWADHVEGKK